MQSMPTVSVLMAAYNSETYIAKAIASVMRQHYTDWELIVVDDGSDDWTYQIACSFGDRRIRVYQNTRNRGKTLSMQSGLEHCTGKYILEMDSDDWLDPDCLSVLVASMDAQSEQVAMIYGDRAVYRKTDGATVFQRMRTDPIIKSKYQMLTYVQGIGPRFYRRQSLLVAGGWRKEPWGDGTLYEDVSLILRLLEKSRIKQIGYTGYNILKHGRNITELNRHRWWPTMKRLVPYFLHRWGDEYVAQFDDQHRKIILRHKGADRRERLI